MEEEGGKKYGQIFIQGFHITKKVFLPEQIVFFSGGVTTLPKNLTDPFTTLELQNPSPDVSELNMLHRYPDLEALKL